MYRLNLGLGIASVLVTVYWLGSVTWHGNYILDYPFWTVMTAVPPLWLLAAAALSRNDSISTRLVVSLASGFTLLLHTQRLVWWVDDRYLFSQWWYAKVFGMEYAPALLAVTTLIPVTVGWWHRRQDRFADADSAD